MSLNIINKIRKNGHRIIDHFVEAILIFASVFLAFSLTEYRESRDKEKNLNISMHQIANEMKYNHKRIELVFDNYSKLIQEIDSIRNDCTVEWEDLYGYNLKSWHGMQTPMLRSTAYHTFINSAINEKANLDLAKDLADIYNMQSIIERVDNSFFEMATVDRGFTALPKVRHITGIYYELLPALLELYQQEGKKWLEKFGYDNKIINSKLNNIISEKK